MLCDPRFSGNKTYLTELQCEEGVEEIVKFLDGKKEDDTVAFGSSDIDNISNEEISSVALISPWSFNKKEKKRPSIITTTTTAVDLKAEISYIQKFEIDDVFKFYEEHSLKLPLLSSAASLFLLPSSTSIDSERFYSDATTVYDDKHRNRLSAATASKLLIIRVTQKKQKINNSENMFTKLQEEESSDEEHVDTF